MEYVEPSFIFNNNFPIVDVRTSAEYSQGHIPRAINVPIFTNEERAIIGTIYKNANPEAAKLEGLNFVGPKMQTIAKMLMKIALNKTLIIHCWRGGLRSASIAWLGDFVGLKTYIIKGGYKAYRSYIRMDWFNFKNIYVLGGLTGVGKTDILNILSSKGVQFLDLESFASHKGSAFGAIGMNPQPTNEQFENSLFEKIKTFNPNQPIWVENESQTIGSVRIPEEFFKNIKTGILIHLEASLEFRKQRLVNEYSNCGREPLVTAVKNIAQQLGGLNTKTCLEALENDDYLLVVELCLQYYDKAYLHSVNKASFKSSFKIQVDNTSSENHANMILDFVSKNKIN